MQIIEKIPRLKPRRVDAHKGDFGKVCIIAGSVGFSGAAALAGKAALRSGAGLVRVAVPKSILSIVASIEPSYTTIPLEEDAAGRISKKALNTILNILPENDCIAIGSGIGVSSGLGSILMALIEQENLKLVIDADGLNNLAAIKNWHSNAKANIILTPHPGEMKRLWPSVLRELLPPDRTSQAVQLAKKTRTIVVLKGAGTIVTDGQSLYINKTGNPGMATAGTGDVLTGCIAALLGQSATSATGGADKSAEGGFNAAILGVYIHGLAGDFAAQRLGQAGLIATDIIDALPQAFMKHSV
jgi:ADP-dependent NAD(P)H-hydrate dehydratase